MGTRHCVVAIVDGEHKIAQYGQWDGYPTGQGRTICNFIQNEMDLEKFRNALRETRFLEQSEIYSMWKENVGVDLEASGGTVEWGLAQKFGEIHPELSRDTGADILALVQNGVRGLKNSIDFVKDSLFCEYAYVVDTDNEVLEVYSGFNKEPVPEGERFSDLEAYTGARVDGDRYYPVKLLTKVPFAEATEEFMERLEQSLYDEEDEE